LDSNSQQAKDSETLALIEEYLAGPGRFGIDPKALSILDNVDSSRSEIASVEHLIDPVIAMRLRKLAGAVFRGMARHGTPTTFNDVIATLGMMPARTLIIAIALFSRLGPEHRRLETVSTAVSIFAKIIAEQMGFDRAAAEEAALGGLLLDLGRVVIAMYQSATKVELGPDFERRHHRRIASSVIAQFNLPDFILEIVQEDRFVLQRRAFSIQGVVFLASALVEKITDASGLIELKSPLPAVAGNLEVTLGSVFFDYFVQIGLGRFVRIIPC